MLTPRQPCRKFKFRHTKIPRCVRRSLQSTFSHHLHAYTSTSQFFIPPTFRFLQTRAMRLCVITPARPFALPLSRTSPLLKPNVFRLDLAPSEVYTQMHMEHSKTCAFFFAMVDGRRRGKRAVPQRRNVTSKTRACSTMSSGEARLEVVDVGSLHAGWILERWEVESLSNKLRRPFHKYNIRSLAAKVV